MATTITTGSGHGYEAGDVIEVITLDRRWWKRFWHFVTFRTPPTKRERLTVKTVSSTTMDIGASLDVGG